MGLIKHKSDKATLRDIMDGPAAGFYGQGIALVVQRQAEIEASYGLWLALVAGPFFHELRFEERNRTEFHGSPHHISFGPSYPG